jgi:predicted site-specific integrase-resolvase
MDNEFVNMKVAKKILGLSISTLRNYEKEGKIECIKTENGWRKFNVKKYLLDNKIEIKEEIKKNYIYCRVSSYDRKEDLQRQVDFLKNKYPTYEVITDIGSGINFKRKGLKKLIKIAIANELKEVVVTYKDRLCRIGYDLIEFIFKDYSNAKIIIENTKEKNINEEITEDLIEIITVYSSKLHGRRSNKIEEK